MLFRSVFPPSFDSVFLWHQTTGERGRFVCGFCERAVTGLVARQASLAGNGLVKSHLGECMEMEAARKALVTLWEEGNDLGDGGGLVEGRKLVMGAERRVDPGGTLRDGIEGKKESAVGREEEVEVRDLWSEGESEVEVPLKVVAAAKAFLPPTKASQPEQLVPQSKLVTPPKDNGDVGRGRSVAAKKPRVAPKPKPAKKVVEVEESSSDEDDDVVPNFEGAYFSLTTSKSSC